MKDIYRKYINHLEVNFYKFESKIDPPLLIGYPEHPKFRYTNPTRLEIIIMKSARYISGLNAAMLLLYEGYREELGAIYRILKEIDEDILFLIEGYPSKELTEDQQRYIKEFLQEEFDIPEDPIKSAQKRDRVPRKKILKSLGRLFSDFTPYERAKELSRTIYNAYSGYIHCAYPHIMEMYGGSPPKYHLNGMKDDTHSIKAGEDNMKSFIYIGINIFLQIVQVMDLNVETDDLRRIINNYEIEAELTAK